jgi:hypothetical protein
VSVHGQHMPHAAYDMHPLLAFKRQHNQDSSHVRALHLMPESGSHCQLGAIAS